jgi:uncharacterized protein YciI
MRFLVIVRAFDTITSEQEITRLRETVIEKVQELTKSGKLIESGNFVAGRAGFWILDAASSTELWELLFPLQDFGHIETHPIQSWEELGEGFKKLGSK